MSNRPPFWERHPILTTALAVSTVAVLAVATYLLAFATSHIRGEINQRNQINSGSNRTFQYQHFFDLDATIKSEAENITSAQAQVSADAKLSTPTDAIAEQAQQERIAQDAQNLTGLRQLCVSNANQYNADAREFTRDEFLSSSLPNQESLSACGGT